MLGQATDIGTIKGTEVEEEEKQINPFKDPINIKARSPTPLTTPPPFNYESKT